MFLYFSFRTFSLSFTSRIQFELKQKLKFILKFCDKTRTRWKYKLTNLWLHENYWQYFVDVKIWSLYESLCVNLCVQSVLTGGESCENWAVATCVCSVHQCVPYTLSHSALQWPLHTAVVALQHFMQQLDCSYYVREKN